MSIKALLSDNFPLRSKPAANASVMSIPTGGTRMTGYRVGSRWSDLNELKCLLAYKQLEEANFPRGMLSDLATEIALQSGLAIGSVKAKIGNYKSVAGVTGHSNASQNTFSMYKSHGHLSSAKLRELLQSGTYS